MMHAVVTMGDMLLHQILCGCASVFL